jgi:hypothetical protein
MWCVTLREAPRDVTRCAAGGMLGTFKELGGPGLPIGMNPARFDLANLWIAYRRGIYIDVYAGANLVPARRAGLAVLKVNPKLGTPAKGSGWYPLPRPAPRLTLTCVRGDVLSLRYPGGRGTFDLGTYRYVLPK